MNLQAMRHYGRIQSSTESVSMESPQSLASPSVATIAASSGQRNEESRQESEPTSTEIHRSPGDNALLDPEENELDLASVAHVPPAKFLETQQQYDTALPTGDVDPFSWHEELVDPLVASAEAKGPASQEVDLTLATRSSEQDTTLRERCNSNHDQPSPGPRLTSTRYGDTSSAPEEDLHFANLIHFCEKQEEDNKQQTPLLFDSSSILEPRPFQEKADREVADPGQEIDFWDKSVSPQVQHHDKEISLGATKRDEFHLSPLIDAQQFTDDSHHRRDHKQDDSASGRMIPAEVTAAETPRSKPNKSGVVSHPPNASRSLPPPPSLWTSSIAQAPPTSQPKQPAVAHSSPFVTPELMASLVSASNTAFYTRLASVMATNKNGAALGGRTATAVPGPVDFSQQNNSCWNNATSSPGLFQQQDPPNSFGGPCCQDPEPAVTTAAHSACFAAHDLTPHGYDISNPPHFCPIPPSHQGADLPSHSSVVSWPEH